MLISFSFCRDISFWSPYKVKEQPRELKFTYLDTIGRPVVVITAENLVEQHIQDFQVSYTFSSIMLLQEPLLVVAALYLFFLMVIIVVRLDFSITEVGDVCVLLRKISHSVGVVQMPLLIYHKPCLVELACHCHMCCPYNSTTA